MPLRFPKKRRMMMLRSCIIQIALIAGSWSYCDGQNLTSVPAVAPNATSAVPISVASLRPSVSQLPSSRQSESPSLRPSVSAAPSERPSLDPSLRPSVSQLPSSRQSESPSLRPSVSAAPSISLTPSTQPSSAPSEKPSTSPTSSFKPSLSATPTSSFEPSVSAMPTPSPTVVASDHPSQMPSDIPSSGPTDSVAPSFFPSDVPSSVPTISTSPSMTPSISSQPSDSFVPSTAPSGHPTVSARPSDTPSSVPSTSPTASPSLTPSFQPSSQPTVPVTTVTQPFLAMTFEGLMDNFSPNEIADWEVATSNHVHDFWDELPFSPIYVGRVATSFISQRRVQTQNSTEQSRQFTFEPLEILYEQTASFGLLVEELDDRLVPAEDSVFLEPFRQNSLPYVRTVIEFTGNMGPVYLTNIEIRAPQPTPAPAQIPEGGGNNDDERRIILIVVLIVGTAVLSAIGYIVYLTRKDNLDSPDAGALALEDYGSDSGNDIYYMSNSMQSPSSTQVMANVAQSASFESDVIDSPSSVRSAYSDTRVQDMEVIADARRLHERSASFPSSSLQTIDDPDATAAQQASSGSIATFGESTDAMQFSTGNLNPSMEGFNLQIEDIED